MFYAVEILSHKKPLGVPWICGVYDARSKLQRKVAMVIDEVCSVHIFLPGVTLGRAIGTDVSPSLSLRGSSDSQSFE